MLLIAGLVIVAKPVRAAETIKQTYLDQPTITKGYTVVTPDANLRVGVVSGVVSEPVTVTVKRLLPNEITVPEGYALVSGIYEYDFIGQSSPLILAKPYQLALKFTSDNYREKSLYYWNTPTSNWVKLPGQVKWALSEARGISPLPYSKVAVFEAVPVAHEPLRLAVDPAKETTAAFADTSARAVLPAGATSGPATLEVKDGGMPAHAVGLRLVSALYIFDVTGTNQIKLGQPMALTLKYDSDSVYRRAVYYWDRNASSWRGLPSMVDYDAKTVTARTVLKYATIGVFETDELAIQEGVASYYASKKYTNAAANNVFPYDAKLKVTNLANMKSTVVTVKSKGPFVPGRVIDLVKTAFAEIANHREGVIRVRVEKL
jgi:hypothetical protein